MYVRTREGNGPSPRFSLEAWRLSSIVLPPIPVLDLTQIQRGSSIRPFARKPSGFETFFSDDVPSPQAKIVVKGKLLMEENGVRRAITAAELKKLQPKTIVNYVYAEHGVSIATNYISKIKPDGSFTTQSLLVVDPGTRRIRVRVILELKGGDKITADAIAQSAGLDRFLALINSFESRRPIGRVTGTCHIAAGHFEFLSSVRKMFQPAPGSSLAPLFDEVLHRNRKICQLADVNSAEGRNIRSFEILNIGNNEVDIGHVLVGIEAHRRQKPNSQLFTVMSSQDARTEAFMTWAGDLGSALEPYAEAIVAGRMVNIKTYLKKASVADLLGDIDGINIGSVYDETQSLANNLSNYYRTKPFRRFRQYLAQLKDDSGNRLFSLTQQRPPKLSPASRVPAAHYISHFATAVSIKRNVFGGLTQSQQSQFSSMLQPGSKEMNFVLDYFFAFLEGGLAKEA